MSPKLGSVFKDSLVPSNGKQDDDQFKMLNSEEERLPKNEM
jgi:hypothetical protein